MAVAILDREHQDPEAEADAYRTAAVLDSAPPAPPAQPEVSQSEDEALAAAYAALGAAAPQASTEVEMQAELGSRSARAVAAPVPRASSQSGEIQLRELQP